MIKLAEQYHFLVVCPAFSAHNGAGMEAAAVKLLFE
jgi:hypothetical protein